MLQFNMELTNIAYLFWALTFFLISILKFLLFILIITAYNCRSVEISPSLAEVQRETVGQVQSHLSKFKVECRDASERTGWGGFLLYSSWNTFIMSPFQFMFSTQPGNLASYLFMSNSKLACPEVWGRGFESTSMHKAEIRLPSIFPSPSLSTGGD